MFRKSKTDALKAIQDAWQAKVQAKKHPVDECVHAWQSLAKGSNVVRCSTCGEERHAV